MLNDWLRRRALANHLSGASRSYVAADRVRVAAYYCLAAGAIQHLAATGNIRRNMPDTIPAVLLGRLAVDANYQGRGLGAALLEHALARCRDVAEIAGVRVLLVRAKDEEAAAFYRRFGFIPSPLDGMTLMAGI